MVYFLHKMGTTGRLLSFGEDGRTLRKRPIDPILQQKGFKISCCIFKDVGYSNLSLQFHGSSAAIFSGVSADAILRST